jgi:hypothetical protein
LGILGAILGLLIIGGVCYLFNRFPYLGVGAVVLVVLVVLGIYFWASWSSSSSSPRVEATDKKPHQDGLFTSEANSLPDLRDRKLDLRDWKPDLREYKREDWQRLIIGVVIVSLIMGYVGYELRGWIGAIIGGIFGGVVSGIGFILRETPGCRRWS